MIVYASCPNCDSKNILPVITCKDYTVSGEKFDIWECKNCTQRFTQNIPDKEGIEKYYQSENYISHSDTSKGFINNIYHKVRKRTLVQKRKLVETDNRKNNRKYPGCRLRHRRIFAYDERGRLECHRFGTGQNCPRKSFGIIWIAFR